MVYSYLYSHVPETRNEKDLPSPSHSKHLTSGPKLPSNWNFQNDQVRGLGSSAKKVHFQLS